MLVKTSFISALLLLVMGSVTAQRPQPSSDVLLGEWDAKLARIESKVREQIQLLTAQNDQLKAEVNQLKSQGAVRRAESQRLKQQVEDLVGAKTTAAQLIPTAAIEDRAAPRNCTALTLIGHRLSGLYMVQAANNQIQTVYCEINQLNGAVSKSLKNCYKLFKPISSKMFDLISDIYLVTETVVGYNDIKSAPVYFYVQRNMVYSTTKTTIPYNIAKLNLGNAMNLATGVFTVPTAGRYFFTLSGISQVTLGSTRVYLFVNGVDVASSFAVDKFDTYALQATLDLKAGDLVTSYFGKGSVGDGAYMNMHITGILLEGDLKAF